MSKIEKATSTVSEAVVISLKHPINFGKETITEVVIQPLKGRHLRGLSANPSFDDIMKVAAKASGLSDKIFDEMRSEDLKEVVETVGNLL